MSRIFLSVIAAVLTIGAYTADLKATPVPPTISWEATNDPTANNRWEAHIGAGQGLDFELDPQVLRVTPSPTRPGITSAYSFPGGATGNQDVALLSLANSGTRRSFQNLGGDASNENVTLEIWFKANDPGTTTRQILFEDGGGTGLGFFIDNNTLRVSHAGGGVRFKTANIGGITSNYIQAVATYQITGDPNELELYVNGAVVPGGVVTGGSNDWTGGDPAGLGTRGGANTGGLGGGQQGTESFDGEIAVFRIYRNQILSPTDVLQNFRDIATPEEIVWDDGDPNGANSGGGNGNQNWATGSNWRLDNTGGVVPNDIAPGAIDRANIAFDSGTLGGGPGSATPAAGPGGAALIKAGDNITVSSMRIGVNPGLGYGGNGRLDMTGGTLIFNDIGQGRHMVLGNSGNRTGTFVMTDGQLDFAGVGGQQILVGSSDGQGFFDLRGGVVNALRGGIRIADGSNSTNGTMRVSGGTINNEGGNFETADNGTGHLIFTGGTINIISNNWITGQAGSSEAFVIIGGGAINANMNVNGGNGARDWNTNSGDGDVEVKAMGIVRVGRDLNLGSNNSQGGLKLLINGGTVEIGRNINYRNGGPRDEITLQAGLLDLTGGNINFSNSNNGSDFVMTGGTLLDVNNFAATLNQNGGIVAPGAGIDIMNITNGGDYNQNGGIYLVEYNNTSNDLINVVNGDAILDGIIKLASDPGSTGVNPILIGRFFDVLTANTIMFDSLTLDTSMAATTTEFEFLLVNLPNGQVALRINTVVPEPTTGLLALLSVSVLGVRRRRRSA